MPKKTSPKDKEDFLKIYGDNENYYSIRKSCKESKISKSTFYRWLKDLEFKKEIDKIKERKKNDLFKQIRKGNARACIKFLKTYAKERGY